MKKLLAICVVVAGMILALGAGVQATTVNVSLEPSTWTGVDVGQTFDLDLWLRSSDGSPVTMSSIELLLEWDPAYVEFSGSASTVNGDYDWTTAMSMMPLSSNSVPMYAWEGSAGENQTYADGDAWIQLTNTFTWLHSMSDPQTDLNALTLTFTALDYIDSTVITAGLGANSGVPPTTGDSYYIVEDGSGVYIGGTVTGADVSIAAPVPEPSTMLLVGTGLIGIVAFGRKRLNKKA